MLQPVLPGSLSVSATALLFWDNNCVTEIAKAKHDRKRCISADQQQQQQ